MFIRNQLDPNKLIGNKTYTDQLSKLNKYSHAFPFDRASNGTPASVAFIAIHGMNSTVTSAADLWPQNIIRTFPANGFTIGVSSSSSNDVNISGSGAQIIEVDMLDINYNPYTLIFSMDGQNKVIDTNFVNTAYRINDIRVKSVGTGACNAGDIYVYDSSDTVTAGVPQTSTKIFHKLSATENVGRGFFYTVPAGCQLQTQQVRGGFNDNITTARSGILNLWFYRYRSDGVPLQTYFPITGQVTNGSAIEVSSPDLPPIFDEKTDITMHAASSASAVMVAYMDGILYYK